MDLVTYALCRQEGEGGGGGAKPMLVTVNSTTQAADKSYAEVAAAISAGKSVIFKVPVLGSYAYLSTVGVSSTAIQATGTAWVLGVFQVVYLLDSSENGSMSLLPIQEVPSVETLSGSEPYIQAADNKIYKCGEATSVTVSVEGGSWSLIFTSGATPTSLTMPSTVQMPDDFEVEANRRYEINVDDGYALVASWEVSAS